MLFICNNFRGMLGVLVDFMFFLATRNISMKKSQKNINGFYAYYHINMSNRHNKIQGCIMAYEVSIDKVAVGNNFLICAVVVGT
jgi:hypothetical protein